MDLAAQKKRKLEEGAHEGNRVGPAGSVTLVCSDGVGFELPAYQLQASTVFRSMIEIESPGHAIELHDTKTETSSIITHFFDISTRDVDISTDAIPVDDALAVIEFAKKYNFAKDLKMMLLQVCASMLHDDSGHCRRHYYLSVALGDMAAIWESLGHCWNENIYCETDTETKLDDDADIEVFGLATKCSHLFDVSTWSLDELRRLDIAHVWALMRASRDPGGGVRYVHSYSGAYTVAHEYRSLMELQGAPPLAFGPMRD